MACGQRQELFAPAVEERVVADEKRAGVLLDKGGEGGVEFVFGAGLQDMELQPLSRAPLPATSLIMRSVAKSVRVHEQGDHLGLRNQVGKQLEPLEHQLGW